MENIPTPGFPASSGFFSTSDFPLSPELSISPQNNVDLVGIIKNIITETDNETLKNYMDTGINYLKNLVKNINIPQTTPQSIPQTTPQPKIENFSSSNVNSNLLYNYLLLLMKDLYSKGLINTNDINTIKLNLESKKITINNAIMSLEKVKKASDNYNPGTNYNIQNELPAEFLTPLGNKIANDWSNDYTILNTNKWQVPTPRPPVCINNSPCKVCPLDSSPYSISLQQWDDARYVLQKPN